MRLMLGREEPELLVSVRKNFTESKFAFRVINGGWEGIFDQGKIFVKHPREPFWADRTMVILCKDQDRLRGDYQEVFNNFHDESYIAPMHEAPDFSDLADDVAF